MKKEEYLQETARNCEELKKTVSEYEEKMSELQEKSTNSSENIETPRVKYCREKFIFKESFFRCQLESNLACLILEAS